jgi:hypothetical protein
LEPPETCQPVRERDLVASRSLGLDPLIVILYPIALVHPEAPEHEAPADAPAVDELCRLLARIVTRLRTEPVTVLEEGVQ